MGISCGGGTIPGEDVVRASDPLLLQGNGVAERANLLLVSFISWRQRMNCSKLPAMAEPHAIHVVLQNWEGKYLAGQTGAWSFSDQIDEARVFDYVADRIPQQLEMLEQNHGISLEALPLDPRVRFETCDRCGQHMLAFKIYFDGKAYLCADCRR